MISPEQIRRFAEEVSYKFSRIDEAFKYQDAERNEMMKLLLSTIEEQKQQIEDLQETVSELVLLTGPTESKDN